MQPHKAKQKSKRATKPTLQDSSIMDRQQQDRKEGQHLTACKQYCLAAGATQGNIAYTQNVMCNPTDDYPNIKRQK